jgi:hypothetical protein
MNDTKRRPLLLAPVGPLLLALALVIAGLLESAGALAAGSVVVSNPTMIPTVDAGAAPTRTNDALYFISYEDCKNNVVFQFDVALNGVASTGFYVYGTVQGSDCSQQANRNTANTDPLSSCHALVTSYPSNGRIQLRAYDDLVSKLLGLKSCDDTSLTGPQQIKLYVFVSPDGTDATTVAATSPWSPWLGTQIILVGPSTPGGIEVDPGDSALFVNMPNNATNSDGTAQGYYFFCYAAGGVSTTSGSGGVGGASASSSTGGTGGASASSSSSSGSTTSSSAGGTGGAGTSSSSSTSASSTGTSTTGASTSSSGGTGGSKTTTNTGPATGKPLCQHNEEIPDLVMNGHVDINSKYFCGSQGPGTLTSYTISKDSFGNALTNNQTYVVAVAAYDAVYNLGTLSEYFCQYPQPVNSFFPEYCSEGGPGCIGGCGSCNVGSRTDPLWPALGAAALAAVGLAVRHDRRRRRRGAGRA